MKNKVSKVTNRRVMALFVSHTILVVVVAVLIYMFIEYIRLGSTGEAGPIGQYIFNLTEKSLYFFARFWPKLKDPVISRALGLIIPMVVIMFPFNMNISRILYRSVVELTDGIEKLGSGDFSARLDVKKGAVFTHVFKCFNKTAKELSEVNKLRDDFVNNYSHEFKTPIASINGFSKLLIEQKDLTDEERETYLKIIYNESARLADMANSTMMLSKLNSQQIITDKAYYSLDEQLRHCVILLTEQWTAKELDVSCELDAIKYCGNSELMERLWLNLIGNAIKYTGKRGEIAVSAHKKDSKIVVKITDTGIGMCKETLDRVFEQYYQGDKAHSTEGLGLGLPICKRIVELCSGQLKIESEIDVGTVITVILPI